MSILAQQYTCAELEFQAKEHVVKGELCLVNASLLTLQQYAQEFLHPTEFNYFSTLTFARRQLSYLLGRFAAKQALAHYINKDISLIHILIYYGAFQYPLVSLPDKDQLQVSYSHSGEYSMALAFPEVFPLAIDLEAIDPDKNEVIDSQVTAGERQLLGELQVNPDVTLTLIWTIKEALSKVLRTGMMSPFDIFSIKSIKFVNDRWISEFINFAQYQAISFPLGQFIFTIVCPKGSQLTVDIVGLQRWMAREKQ